MAKNSNGEHQLSCTRDGGEIFFTMTGKYKGEDIQIDFNCMSVADLEDFIFLMQRRVDAAKPAGKGAA
jgi:hypothetical protein